MKRNKKVKYSKYYLDKLKKINLQYCDDLFETKLFKKRDKIYYNNGCIILKYFKDRNQTWLDYFLTLKGEDKHIGVDCRMATHIIDLFLKNHQENYLQIKLFPGERDFVYLEQPKEEDYALAHYTDLHPGIWVVEHNGKYIGLSNKGVKEDTKEGWYNFLKKDRKKYKYKYIEKVKKFYIFKVGDEYYAVIDRKTNNKVVVKDNHIEIYINDEYKYKFKEDNIGGKIVEYLKNNKDTIGLGVDIHEDELNLSVGLKNASEFKLNKFIEHITIKFVSKNIESLRSYI